MKKIILTAIIAALGVSVAAADEIQLTNGRRLTGKVTKKDGVKVTVEVGAGTITLDAKDVSSVNPGRTAFEEAQIARGLVLHEDRWVTKAEVQLIEKRRLEAKERAMAAEDERKRRVE